MSDPVITEGDYPAGKVFISIMGMAVVCALLSWGLSPATVSAVPQLMDLSDATFVEIRTLDGKVAMSGELRSRVDALGNVEKDAALLGPQYERVVGEIEIEIPRKDAPDTRQELEVDVISLQPRTTYRVVVNDRLAATFTTDDRGSVDVEFLSGPPAAR